MSFNIIIICLLLWLIILWVIYNNFSEIFMRLEFHWRIRLRLLLVKLAVGFT